MSEGIYAITEQFEDELAKYTSAPYVITIDNASNALFLCLLYENVKGMEIIIPERTYPSVACCIVQSGAKVKFKPVEGKFLTGMYFLEPTNIIDSCLHFTTGMYIPNTHMCISFTGFRKFLKLGVKAGAILTDNQVFYKWAKKMRFSGRNECGYMEDTLDTIGYNFYLCPEVSLRGLMLMEQFYNLDGTPKHNEDLSIPYPKLSDFPCYTNPEEFDEGLNGRKKREYGNE